MTLEEFIEKRKRDVNYTSLVRLSGYGRSTMDNSIKRIGFTKKQYKTIYENYKQFAEEFLEDLELLREPK